jgi:hypothetical protein
VGRPRWRTTALNVFCRAVADLGIGRCRAGNNPGRDRTCCQDARNRCRVRSARGTSRSLPPLPGRTRTSRRWGSIAVTCRGVPSLRRSPPA